MRHVVRKLESLWFVLIPIAALALVGGLEPAMHGKHADVALLLRNALPVALALALLYGLSGRTLFSLWVGGNLFFAVFMVNGIKERNLNAPLMPGDLVVTGQVFDNLEFFSQYTRSLALLGLGLALFFAVAIVLWKYCVAPRRRPMLAWGVAGVSAALLYTMLSGVGPWATVYSNQALHFAIWNPGPSVQRCGLMAGLVRMSQEKQVEVPQPDQSLIARFAEAHGQDIASRAHRDAPQTLPDIVIVQSEAFFEPGIIKGIDEGQYLPNFQRLAATGISGHLRAPTYGGGTIRTEFSVLTGYSILAFPSVSFPYYGLAQAWMPSIPNRLRALGYSTTLLHPFKSGFWNRRTVMPKLGFEKMHFQEDFAGAARAGMYVSDKALFSHVLKQLDAPADGPRFVMAITMENHGPWGHPVYGVDAVEDADLPAGLSPKGRMELRYYLSHVRNGDRALGDFVGRLLARDRWTVLLFYGDHLPSLNAAFADLGFDDGQPLGGNEKTRYMLLSNRAIEPHRVDLRAFELPALLFDTIGLPEDGHLAFDGVITKMMADDQTAIDPNIEQVLYNTARKEVLCHETLDASGECNS